MIFGIRVLLGVHLDVPKLETIVYTLGNAALMRLISYASNGSGPGVNLQPP